MWILEITALENGAHRNQTWTGNFIPDGWAMIPDGMEIPDTFPFVNIEVDNYVVTAMTAGVVPPSPPEPDPDPTLDERVTTLEETKADKTEVDAVWDEMAAAYSKGVQDA